MPFPLLTEVTFGNIGKTPTVTTYLTSHGSNLETGEF
jgi:hypothetical protein